MKPIIELNEYDIRFFEGDAASDEPDQSKIDYWDSLSPEEKRAVKDWVLRRLDLIEASKGDLNKLVELILIDDDLLEDMQYGFDRSFYIGDYRFEPESRFGGEGQGDDYWFVCRVEREGQDPRYFKFFGWYTSYDGGEIESVKEVKPKTKTITVYE